MNRNASFTFNLEEWEKKPRKPFNIKKTWSRNKSAAVPTEKGSGETVESFNDDKTSSVTLPIHLRSPSPPTDLITDKSHQKSSRSSLTKDSDSSAKNKTPGSRALSRILENTPSLRNTPLSASRHYVPDRSQQASSSKAPPKTTDSKKDFAEKPRQKLTVQNHQHSDTEADKVSTGRKRSLSSSSSKQPTKHVKRLTPSDEEESQSVTVSDQMVDLWTCSKHVQRKKSDLCEIDIVMSSLRDIGHEMFEESDDEVEQKVIQQVVKKTLESLWKLVKESAVNKNNESELKKVTKELTKARAELLAKGKERNQELMKLSELQEKAKELAQYEKASSSKEVRTKFNTLKQNLPTILE